MNTERFSSFRRLTSCLVWLSALAYATSSAVPRSVAAQAMCSLQTFDRVAAPLGGSSGAEFGTSVALSGDGVTALAGAPYDQGGGSVQFYRREGNVWVADGPRISAPGGGYQSFGISVALSQDGSTAAVGAYVDGPNDRGSVYVFTRQPSGWIAAPTRIFPPNAIPGAADGRVYFGVAVSLSRDGKRLLIGASGESSAIENGGTAQNAGAAYVYTKVESGWTQEARITHGPAESRFGRHLALSGDGLTAVMSGASVSAKSAEVFVRVAGVPATWQHQPSATDGYGWGSLIPTSRPCYTPTSGYGSTYADAIALSDDGNTCVVTAKNDGDGVGCATVFSRSGEQWMQRASVTPPGEITRPGRFGTSVAISADGTLLLFGAPDNAASQGAAYVFRLDGGNVTWLPTSVHPQPIGVPRLGESVALSSSGTAAMLGAPNDAERGGAVYFSAAPHVVYVRRESTGLPMDGRSWDTAYHELRDALVSSDLGCASEIWVARGTYTPSPPISQGGSRSDSFNLRNNLAIYGGFVGTETTLAQRPALPANTADALNPAKATILSGDLNGNDSTDPGKGDNALHVVNGAGTDATAALDGFTITGGHANIAPDTEGAGFCIFGAGSPRIRNCTFTRNSCTAGGGNAAIVRSSTGSSSPKFNNCRFDANTSSSPSVFGGAFYHFGAGKSILTDCDFTGNSAGSYGGAVGIESGEAAFIRCKFVRNYAAIVGGAVDLHTSALVDFVQCQFLGNSAGTPGNEFTGAGAVHCTQDSGSKFIGCLFVGNSAPTSGAIGASGPSDVNLFNCTIAGNVTGSNSFGALARVAYPGTAMRLRNCLVWGNTNGAGAGEGAQIGGQPDGSYDVQYSSVQGWTGARGGAMNNDSSPMFTRSPLPGPDGVWGTTDDDYGNLLPLSGSAAIDSGDSTLYAPGNNLNDIYDINGNGDIDEQVPWDVASFPRFVDDPSVLPNVPLNTPGPVDRGCYERPFDCPTCPGTREWLYARDAGYSDLGVWYPSAPASTHDTHYAVNGVFDITFPSGTTNVKSAAIDGGDIAWLLPSNGTYNLTATNKPALTIGNAAGDAAALTMSGPAGGGGAGGPGGLFKPTGVSIGNDPTATGTLTVTGTGTKLLITAQGLTIGSTGQGTFNLTGGALATTRIATLGDQAGSFGSALVQGAGSTWNVPFYLTINNGHLTVRDGGIAKTGFGTFLLQGGTLDGNGTIDGPVVNFGRIAPGNSPGTLTITHGDFTQVGSIPDFGNAAGTLELEVNGTSPGQYDQLIVQHGLTELGGGLTVKSPGDQLAIAPGVGSGDISLPLVKALGGINLNSRFDVVFLPRATVPTGQPQQFFKIDYLSGVPGGGDAVNMTNLVLGTGLAVNDPTNALATGTPTAAAAADLDGDGLSDLILTFNGNTENDNGQALILLNLGADPGDASAWLGFGSSQTLNTGKSPSAITVFDIDGDGLPDIAVSNRGSNSVSLFKNRPATNAGTLSRVADFEAKGTVSVGSGPTGLTIDNFAGAPSLPPGGGARSLVGGLRPTLVCANEGEGDSPSSMTVALSDPNDAFNFITLPPILILPTGKIPFKPAPINLDGVVRPDLAILSRDGSAVIVFPNTSTGTAAEQVGFGDPIVIPTDTNPIDMAIANLDGEEGIVTVNQPALGAGTMSVIVNHTPVNTTGTNNRAIDLSSAQSREAGAQPRSVAPVDLEEDGDDDLAVLTKLSPVSTKVRIFRNDFRVGTEQVNDQPTLVNDRDVPELGTTDPLFVLKANLVPNTRPDLLTILASPTNASRSTGGKSAGPAWSISARDAAMDTVQNIRRMRNDSPSATKPSCPLDYNLDTVVNPDDLGDYITDYFTFPHVPGPGGYAIPCSENEPPYDAGYKAAYTPDGSGQCNPPFPDNLGDFITAYFNAGSGC